MSEEKTETVETVKKKRKKTKVIQTPDTKKKKHGDSGYSEKVDSAVRVTKMCTNAIGIAEMKKRGWFQEMNRTMFHPLGLEIQPVRDGKGSAFIIVDLIDSIGTNEIKYGGTIADGSAIKNVESFQAFVRERQGLRKKKYGRVVQSVK